MTAAIDTAYFKQRLLTRRSELTARLARLDSDLGEATSNDDDDRATERETDEVLEGLGNAGLSELRAIDAALERMEAHHYGICVSCGEPISPQRLEAVPHAALCIACHTDLNS